MAFAVFNCLLINSSPVNGFGPVPCFLVPVKEPSKQPLDLGLGIQDLFRIYAAINQPLNVGALIAIIERTKPNRTATGNQLPVCWGFGVCALPSGHAVSNWVVRKIIDCNCGNGIAKQVAHPKGRAYRHTGRQVALGFLHGLHYRARWAHVT